MTMLSKFVKKIFAVLLSVAILIGSIPAILLVSGSTTEQAPVGFLADGASGQRWIFNKVAFYNIKNEATGKYLTLSYNSEGQPVVGTADKASYGATSQAWRVTESPAVGGQLNVSNVLGILLGATETADFNQYCQSVHGTACFTLSGSAITTPASGTAYSIDLIGWYQKGDQPVSLTVDDSGNAALAVTDSQDPSQQWCFELIERVYTVKNAETGRYLTAPDAAPDVNAIVTRAQATTDGTQYWVIGAQESFGSGQLINLRSGKRISAKNAPNISGKVSTMSATLAYGDGGETMMQMDGQTNRIPTPEEGSEHTFHLVNWYTLAGGKTAVLTDLFAGQTSPESPEATVTIDKKDGSDAQQWAFIEVPFYRIKNKQTGEYLSWNGVQFVTAEKNADDNYQLWTLAPTEAAGMNGYVNLINFSGRLMAGTAVSPPVVDTNCATVHGNAMLLLDNTYLLNPENGAEHSIDLVNWFTFDETQASLSTNERLVEFAAKDNSALQTWVFEKETTTYYQVQNKRSQQYLTIADGLLTTTGLKAENSFLRGELLLWQLTDSAITSAVNLTHVVTGKLVGCNEGNPPVLDLSRQPAHGGSLMMLSGKSLSAPASGTYYTIEPINWYTFDGTAGALTEEVDAPAPPTPPAPTTTVEKNVNIQAKDADALGQQWRFTQTALYRVKNKSTGEYLAWDGTNMVTKVLDATDNYQLWTLAPTEASGMSGYINLINYSGRLIGGTSDQSATALDINLLPLHGNAMLQLDNTYLLNPADGSEHTVDLVDWYKIDDQQASLSVDGSTVKLEAKENSQTQVWVFEKVEQYYRIQNEDTKNFLSVETDDNAMSLVAIGEKAEDQSPLVGTLLWKVEASSVSGVNLRHVDTDKLIGCTETNPPELSLGNGASAGGACIKLSGGDTTTPNPDTTYTIEPIDWYNFDGTPGALTEIFTPPPTAVEFQKSTSKKSGLTWNFEAYTYDQVTAYRIKNADSQKYLTFDGTTLFTSAETLDDGTQAWAVIPCDASYGAFHLKNVGTGKIIGAKDAAVASQKIFSIDMGMAEGTGQAFLQLNKQINSNPTITENTEYTLDLINWYSLEGNVSALLADPTAQVGEEEPEYLSFAALDNSSETQLWSFQEVVYYQIRNQETGKYLAFDGTNFVLEHKSDDDSQLWGLSPTQASGVVDYLNISNLNGTFLGCNESKTAAMLDTTKQAVHGGACLRLSDQFNLSPSENIPYTIDVLDWFCVDSKQASLSVAEDGTLVLAAKSLSDDNQRWIFEKTTRSYYTIHNVATGGMLTFTGGEIATTVNSHSDGSQVWRVTYDTDKQALSIVHYKTGMRLGSDAQTAVNERYRVIMSVDAADTGNYFRLNNNSSLQMPENGLIYTLTLLDSYKIGTAVAALNDLADLPEADRFVYTPVGSAYGQSVHPTTVWNIVENGEYVLIYDNHTQRYLTVKDGRVSGQRRNGLAYQQWKIEENGKFVTIKNRDDGTYLSLTKDTMSVTLSNTVTETSKWTVTDDKLLQNAWQDDDGGVYYLQMHISDSNAEGTLMMSTQVNHKKQQYSLIQVEDEDKTYYKIQSAWSQNYLTAVEDIRVEEMSATNDDTQLWELKEIASGTFVAINIINKSNGLAIALVDPYNMEGGSIATLQLVGSEHFASGHAMWYLNGSKTINTRVRAVIASLYPSNTVITSLGTEVILPPPPIDDRTIYVSADGNDNNTGLSEDQAIKSIDKLNELIKSMPLTAGNTIKFRKGDTFVGEVHLNNTRGTADYRITITGYGTAKENPKIVAPEILTKEQVEAMLAADPDFGVQYNSAQGEIKNGIVRSALLVEGGDYVTIDGIDAYSTNNGEDAYQFIHDPSALIHINDTTNVVIRNCNLSGEVERRIKDYIADATGANRVLEGYPDGWNASYPPYRGNDYYGILISNCISMDNTDMTNVVIENCDATKLTLGVTVSQSSQFTVKNVLVHDSPCWGISIASSSNGQVIDCVTRHTGYGLNPNGNAAYMVSSCQDILFENIEAYDAGRGPQPYDGVGFDFEGGINQRDIVLRNAVFDGVDGAAIMVFGNTDGNKDFVIDNVFIQNYLRAGTSNEGGINFTSLTEDGVVHSYGNGLVVNTTIVSNTVNGVMMPYYSIMGHGVYPMDVPNVLFIDCNFTSGVNKDTIKELIDAAEALKEADYTAQTWTEFKQALENAKYAYESKYMSEAVVNEIADALRAAMNALEKKPVASGGSTEQIPSDNITPDLQPDDLIPDGITPNGGELTAQMLQNILNDAVDDIITIKLDDPAVITAEMWNMLADAGKGLCVQIVDEQDVIKYIWTFTDIIRDSADFDLELTESANADKINGLLSGENAQLVAFAYRGALPGKTQLIVGNTAGFKAGEALTLHYFDETTQQLVDAGMVSVSSDGGYLAFNLTQAADYSITKADFEKSSDSAVEENNNDFLIVIVLSVAGGIIVIGGLLAVILLLVRRKKREE